MGLSCRIGRLPGPSCNVAAIRALVVWSRRATRRANGNVAPTAFFNHGKLRLRAHLRIFFVSVRWALGNSSHLWQSDGTKEAESLHGRAAPQFPAIRSNSVNHNRIRSGETQTPLQFRIGKCAKQNQCVETCENHQWLARLRLVTARRAPPREPPPSSFDP